MVPQAICEHLTIFLLNYSKKEAIECFTPEWRPSLGHKLRAMFCYREAQRRGLDIGFTVPAWDEDTGAAGKGDGE